MIVTLLCCLVLAVNAYAALKILQYQKEERAGQHAQSENGSP